MDVANFAGNKTFRREVAHFASTLFCETKPTDLEPPFNGISLILEPLNFGGAKSTDNSALGFWAGGRADRINFAGTTFQNPFPRLASIKERGRREHARLLPRSREVNSFRDGSSLDM